jgi:hypothetical protein
MELAMGTKNRSGEQSYSSCLKNTSLQMLLLEKIRASGNIDDKFVSIWLTINM